MIGTQRDRQPSTPFKLTMLNSMAGSDFVLSLERQAKLGIETLDLKDGIFGSRLEDLDGAQVALAEKAIADAGLSVHCFSTSLGNFDIEEGEEVWRNKNDGVLKRLLPTARQLRPQCIRILAAFSTRPTREASFVDHLQQHPWLSEAYNDLVNKVLAAGYQPLIENEAERCIIARPADALALFKEAKLHGKAGFIWDIQNMWQMGHFPYAATVEQLMPILAALHLKGGIADKDGNLAEASSLRLATWPVTSIVSAAVSAVKTPVISLNPSHGRRLEGYDVWEVACDDVAFLKENFGQTTSYRSA